ncbi:hypothetical protein A3Q56_03591, partial [Intoshia linei]
MKNLLSNAIFLILLFNLSRSQKQTRWYNNKILCQNCENVTFPESNITIIDIPREGTSLSSNNTVTNFLYKVNDSLKTYFDFITQSLGKFKNFYALQVNWNAPGFKNLDPEIKCVINIRENETNVNFTKYLRNNSYLYNFIPGLNYSCRLECTLYDEKVTTTTFYSIMPIITISIDQYTVKWNYYQKTIKYLLEPNFNIYENQDLREIWNQIKKLVFIQVLISSEERFDVFNVDANTNYFKMNDTGNFQNVQVYFNYKKNAIYSKKYSVPLQNLNLKLDDISENHVILRWNKIQSSNSYFVDCKKHGNFTTNVNRIYLKNLFPGAGYSCQVLALNNSIILSLNNLKFNTAPSSIGAVSFNILEKKSNVSTFVVFLNLKKSFADQCLIEIENTTLKVNKVQISLFKENVGLINLRPNFSEYKVSLTDLTLPPSSNFLFKISTLKGTIYSAIKLIGQFYTRPFANINLELLESCENFILLKLTANHSKSNGYEIRIKNVNETVYSFNFSIVNFKLKNLSPGEIYHVSSRIKFKNKFSEPQNFFFSTQPESPFLEFSTLSNSITLSIWTQRGNVDHFLISMEGPKDLRLERRISAKNSPKNLYLEKNEWPIENYEKNLTLSKFLDNVNIYKKYKVTFSQLLPYSFYTVHTKSVFNGITSKQHKFEVRTNQAAPSAIRNFFASILNYNTIVLRWSLPWSMNGIIKNFIIIITEHSNGKKLYTDKLEIQRDTWSQMHMYQYNIKKLGSSINFTISACTVACGVPYTILVDSDKAPRFLQRSSIFFQKIPDQFISPTSLTIRFPVAKHTKFYEIYVSTESFNQRFYSEVKWFTFDVSKKGTFISAICHQNKFDELINTDYNKLIYCDDKKCCLVRERIGKQGISHLVNETNINSPTEIQNTGFIQYIIFTLGSDMTCKHKNNASLLCNGPLIANKSYYITVQAVNEYSFDEFKIGPIKTKEPVFPKDRKLTIVYVSMAVIAIVLLLVIFLFFWIYTRKRYNWFNMPSKSGVTHKLSPKSSSRKISLSYKKKRMPIDLKKFNIHTKLMSADSDFLFSEEFEDLDLIGCEMAISVSQLPENRHKNRFTNILPYNSTRVVLKTIDSNPGSDYINANWIPRFVTHRIWKHSESANDCYFCILERRKQTNKLSLYSYSATKTLPIPME